MQHPAQPRSCTERRSYVQGRGASWFSVHKKIIIPYGSITLPWLPGPNGPGLCVFPNPSMRGVLGSSRVRSVLLDLFVGLHVPVCRGLEVGRELNVLVSGRSEVRSREVRSREVRFPEVHCCKVRFRKIRFPKVRSRQVGQVQVEGPGQTDDRQLYKVANLYAATEASSGAAAGG